MGPGAATCASSDSSQCLIASGTVSLVGKIHCGSQCKVSSSVAQSNSSWKFNMLGRTCKVVLL